MGVRLAALLAVVCGLMSVSVADAAAQEPCRAHGRDCVLLTVPLDRAGAVPGTVRLRIERTRAKQPTKPPLFVLVGLPGTSSREGALDGTDRLLRREARSRDIVSMDLRGTGRSGPLRCRDLERAKFAQVSGAAAKCAVSLGARRGFYTARDSADDIEAIRRALHYDAIALLGASYGAQVAFAYAQRYPSRVERLALDSIPGPHGFDILYRPGLAAVPDAIQVLCRKNRCQHVSKHPLAEVSELARRLERGPLKGTLIDGAGRPRKARIRAFDLFQALFLALDGDRSIMGLVHNANRGDARPLLRHLRAPLGNAGAYGFLGWDSPAALAASLCEESPLPWPRATPLADRSRQAALFVDALPAGALLPFGRTAALGSNLVELCRQWPVASAAPEPPRILPPIPTLIVTSVEDMLAPVSSARAVANLIPGSRLLRLRGAGHGVLTGGGGSSCAEQVLHDFLDGTRPDDICGPEWNPERGASRPPPLSLAEVVPDPRVGGRVGRTLRAVSATLRDGGESLELKFYLRLFRPRFDRDAPVADPLSSVRVGGLRHGTYALEPQSWRLTARGASYVPGVRLSGWMTLLYDRHKRRGIVRVSGADAAKGRLVIRRGVMSGHLGGRQVRAPLRLGPDLGFANSATAAGYEPLRPEMSRLLSRLGAGE